MQTMSTPSERLWARRVEWADTAVRQEPRRAREPVTLAAAVARVAEGTELRAAAADFLDDLRWSSDGADTLRRIAAEPPRVDAHTDAYLAALAEHVATANGCPTPTWARQADRFLNHFWWPSRS